MSSASRSALRERLRAKRNALSANVNEDETAAPDSQEVEEEESAGPDTMDESQNEDLKESQALMQDLKKRRKRQQKELSQRHDDEEEDEGLSEMKTARLRTKERLAAAAQKRAAARAAAERDAESQDAEEEPDDEVTEISPMRLGVEDADSGALSARSRPRTPKTGFEDAGASVTPRKSVSKSLNVSMRQRLAEKIRSAKDKAKDEILEESEATGHQFAGIRGKPRTTRFDDPSLMRKEDYEVEQALERSMAIRTKWKQASLRTKPAGVPSKEEAFDFFTRNFEPEEAGPPSKPEDAISAASPRSDASKPATDAEATEASEVASGGEDKEEGSGAAEEGVEEAEEAEEGGGKSSKKKKKKKSTEEKPEDEEPLLAAVEAAAENAALFYTVGRAEYKPFHKKMEDENKRYFVPSIIPAKAEDKIVGQKEPRYLEEEGFYVGTKPIVSPRNVHKMENRLLKEATEHPSAMGWFGEDGCLKSLPDPLKDLPSRPPIIEELDPTLSTVYQKAVVCELDSRLIGGSLEGQGPYQLNVDVNSLTFQHHHLFSREHVLASRLARLHQQYLSRTQKKIVPFLTDKLRALKAASQHVQDNMAVLKEAGKAANVVDQEKRLQDYKEEIRMTRKQRDTEMATDRSLMTNIINHWKEIKKLRTFQQCTNTSIKLQIRKEAVNKVQDETELNQDLEEEMEEMKEDMEDEYNARLKQYKESLEEWKKQKQEKKDAEKRQKKRELRAKKKKTTEASEEDLVQAEKDEDILAAEDRIKPEKPQPLSDRDLRQNILAKYDKIRRKPGEPILHAELSHGATITQNHLCPKGEQNRRNELNRHKVFIRILFNEKEVSRTAVKPVNIDFTVQFAQIFTVEIVQWPESIKLEVYEASGFSSTLLSDVFALIPDASVTSDNVQLEELQFSSEQKQGHPHEAVGSGVAFTLLMGNEELTQTEMTTGVLTCSACWAIDELGNVLIPPTSNKANANYSAMKSVDAIAAIGASGMADMDKLTKWIGQSRLDPNDPSNADLMYLLRPVAGDDLLGAALQMPEYFRLEQLQEEFNFATDDDISSSVRYKLLRLREEEVPEFRNFKMVPSLDKEVPEDVFHEYEKKKQEEEKLKKKDDMESHRAAVALFMQHVREQVMSRFRHISHQKTLADMVEEEGVPNIGTIIPNLMKITEPRRKLKPVRRERKKMTAQNLQQSDVKILVNIVRAFDIPVREESLQRQTGQPAPPPLGGSLRVKNIAGEVQVRPCVEVMFQRNKKCTTVAEGPNPSWNEELALQFRAPNNDYSASNLQSVNDNLFINLFDEIIIDVVQDERQQGTSIHRRIERKWLGSIKIPFSTIYHNSRIDGTFRINTPLAPLGYKHDPTNTRVDADVTMSEKTVNSTYLTMFITIEPPITPAEPIREKFETNEDEKLLLAADNWQYELEQKFPKREFKTTVIDINGKSVFITRYFKSLRTPPDLVDGIEGDAANREVRLLMQEKVARYVSLIPFVSDSVVFAGVCDIWSTCDQFLQMLQGDEEEHAVLLVNYFNYMNQNAWLLLGTAIPEGPTAYVLTRDKEGKNYWVWNPSTGEHYNYRDNYCPVQSVGCLVNQDNIWANIQPVDQPARISFDLSNTSHWKPFFHKGFPNPGLSSVQPENLIYHDPDKNNARELQDKLERLLKDRLREWRPRNLTHWNRHCMQALRRILPKMEESLGNNAQVTALVESELNQILGSYKMTGFPINTQYTGIEPIIETVFSTGVHTNDTNDVEFALAVYVHPYHNSVLSVWVRLDSRTCGEVYLYPETTYTGDRISYSNWWPLRTGLTVIDFWASMWTKI